MGAVCEPLIAGNIPEAHYEPANGQLCFLLSVTVAAVATPYQFCLREEAGLPALRFSLVSAMPLPGGVAAPGGLPVFDPRQGIRLPLVRLGDGRAFTDVLLSVAQHDGQFNFTVRSARALPAASGRSVARLWNDVLLDSIRGDLARPTIHARNLFHTAVAMYDAWAAFDGRSTPYLLGKTRHGFTCDFAGFAARKDTEAARREVLSYAVYTVLKRRFASSPSAARMLQRYEDLMLSLGYDTTDSSRDYKTGAPAALGNYLGDCVIAYGLQDGSNEPGGYAAKLYKPLNPSFFPTQSGTNIVDPDRWQPLSFNEFRDQNGNLFAGSTPPFLTPEWGDVLPFALTAAQARTYPRAGKQWRVYLDPGPPPRLSDPATAADYRWGFALVAAWSAHLSPADGVLWDISPASMGNNGDYPAAPAQYREFYRFEEGGDRGRGYAINPVTGKPYTPQLVPRGDFARVLAEYWADGPQSETPPGHWFTILNYVSDHAQFQRRLAGQGPVLDALEWDVKAYFALGGAMHDAAITAWGIKGYYDYVRPISAIRYMAGLGQSSDPTAPRFHPQGLPLTPGLIEVIGNTDPLAGNAGEHSGKLKLKSWLAHERIQDGAVDQAGVGWIRAELWYPYQRSSFVTPPFAGYISGHSTYSSAAAEVLSRLTGSEYFPGGLGEFIAKKNEYLVFEEGPSRDIVLQWARYRDAADQSALSRIWGGIHPPQDDIPGRRLGITLGQGAFDYATLLFDGAAE